MLWVSFMLRVGFFVFVYAFVQFFASMPLMLIAGMSAQGRGENRSTGLHIALGVFGVAWNIAWWGSQALIVAAATNATLSMHPETWRIVYWLCGFGLAQPFGAFKQPEWSVWETLTIASVSVLYIVALVAPSTIPDIHLSIGSWVAP